MVYSPTTWVDSVTEANATNLNNLEAGVSALNATVGKSLGDYTTVGASAAAQTSALRTLLANEKDVFIPRGSWIVDPATPFELLSGQRVWGVGSGPHGIDPGPTWLSRITVPSGFNGVNIFSGAVGVAHVTLKDFLVDLSAAAVTNTAKGLYLASTGTAEEAQWELISTQWYGSATTLIHIGTGRRAVKLYRTGIFRGSSTVVGTGIVFDGTDYRAYDTIVSGGSSTDAWVGIKMYGGEGRVSGGDIFGCGTGISTSNTNSDGLFIGGGLSIDRSYTQAIYLSPGSGGTINGVSFHANSQQTDNAASHIKCESLGGWTIDNLQVYQEDSFANAAKAVVAFSSGGYGRIGKNIRIKGGIGSGTGPGLRTGISTGTMIDDTTFTASPTIDPSVSLAKNDCWRMTLTGNLTPTISTTGYDGQDLYLFLTQDASGGRTVTWGSEVTNPPTVTTTANLLTVVHLKFQAKTSKWVRISA